MEQCKSHEELFKAKGLYKDTSQQDWRFIYTWQLFDSMQTLL